VAERGVNAVRAVLHDGPLGPAARELAQRWTGTVEVRLLWHAEGDWVELSVCDPAIGRGFRVVVAPSRALDAFYHPFAYAARSGSLRQDRHTTKDDGS
jgi:hypothetical protein